MPQPMQPLLHDLTTLCAAPTQVLCARDGSITAVTDDRATAQGLLHADVRVLSDWRLAVGGGRPDHIATDLDGGGSARFTYLVRELAGSTVDRALRLDLTRSVSPGSLTETLLLSSELAEPVRTEVRIELASDLASMESIRVGRHADPVRFDVTETRRHRRRTGGVGPAARPGRDDHARSTTAPPWC